VNNDAKQKILMFVAIFLTFLMVMNFMTQQEQAKRARQAWEEQRRKALEDRNRPETGSTASLPAERPPSNQEPVAAPPSEPAATPPTPAPAETAEPEAVTEIAVLAGEAEARGQAVFTTRGAALQRFSLQDFFRTPEKTPGEELVLLDEMVRGHASLAIASLDGEAVRQRNYHLLSVPAGATLTGDAGGVERNDEGRLVFRTVVGNWQVTKTYAFGSGPAFGFVLLIEVKNLAPASRRLSYKLVGPSGIVPDDAGRWSPMEVMSAALLGKDATDVEVDRIYVSKLAESREAAEKEGKKFEDGRDKRSLLCWTGLKNRFFTAVLIAEDPDVPLECERVGLPVDPAYVQAHPTLLPLLRANDATGETILETTPKTLAPGQALAHGFRFYGGPADEKALAFDARLSTLVTYTVSWFDWISRYLVKLLDIICGAVGNYGVATILLTLLIKTLLHPLTRKGLHSTQKMQKVAPLVKEIQRKYKDQRDKMHQEVMRLYREQGVSPMGGCLPMLLQLPIFFALYGAFARGFAIRQASFVPGWIDDLAQPDCIWNWGTPLPFLEWTQLSLLPIVYLVMQVIQMSMQPKSDDPQIQQQQKMMKVMPIVFVFIFYTMPAGLVLYFTISSMYTLVEHWLIKRGLDDSGDAGTAAPAGGAAKTNTSPVAAGVGIKALAGGKKKRK